MSQDPADLSPKAVTINDKKSVQTSNYCLQDVRIRIDGMGNNGYGGLFAEEVEDGRRADASQYHMQAATAADADAREHFLVWNLLRRGWSVVFDKKIEHVLEFSGREGG